MITLPASNSTILSEAINPALEMLPGKLTSGEVRCQMLADGRYESRFATRRQAGDGPARGLFQFEISGVVGVMNHHASAAMAHDFIIACGVTYGSHAVLAALETDDVLAAGFARLYLWTDPRPLPAIGDCVGGWDLHERVYRPGAPDYTRWRDEAYPPAVATMRATA